MNKNIQKTSFKVPENSAEIIASLELQLVHEKQKYHQLIDKTKTALGSLQSQLAKDRKEVEDVLKQKDHKIEQLQRDKCRLLSKLMAFRVKSAWIKRQSSDRSSKPSKYFDSKSKASVKRRKARVSSFRSWYRSPFSSFRRRKVNGKKLSRSDTIKAETPNEPAKTDIIQKSIIENEIQAGTFDKTLKTSTKLITDNNSSRTDSASQSDSESPQSVIVNDMKDDSSESDCEQKTTSESRSNSRRSISSSSSLPSIAEDEESQSHDSESSQDRDENEVFDDHDQRVGYGSNLQLNTMIDVVCRYSPIQTTFKHTIDTAATSVSESDTSTLVLQTPTNEVPRIIVSDTESNNDQRAAIYQGQTEDVETESYSESEKQNETDHVRTESESIATSASSSSDFENISVKDREFRSKEPSGGSESTSTSADDSCEQNQVNRRRVVRRKSTLRRSSAILRKDKSK